MVIKIKYKIDLINQEWDFVLSFLWSSFCRSPKTKLNERIAGTLRDSSALSTRRRCRTEKIANLNKAALKSTGVKILVKARKVEFDIHGNGVELLNLMSECGMKEYPGGRPRSLPHHNVGVLSGQERIKHMIITPHLSKKCRPRIPKA